MTLTFIRKVHTKLVSLYFSSPNAKSTVPPVNQLVDELTPQAAERDAESDEEPPIRPKRKRPSRAASSFIQFEAEVDGEASDDEDDSDASEDSFIDDNEDELDL